tara:strand:+ start:82 stop:270 length:189 start_codon:yes stop_codon:yes gene_type:complete
MILSTLAKLKTLSLANQVVTGAFINGALIGGAVVASALIAGNARSGHNGLCKTTKAVDPQDQ